MLVLNDSAAALLYEALTEHDQWLEIPPDRKNECKCKAYTGWLSNITEHAAERYVKFGGNLIRAKQATEVVTKDFDQLLLDKKKEDEETEANPDSDTSVV
jgi:hypothetical protein